MARFAFVVLLFSQLAFAKFEMAIIGDAGYAGPQLNALMESIQKQAVTSLILPGDNLYGGTYEATWNSWKNVGLSFEVVAIGNHRKTNQEEIQYFGMPGEFYAKVFGGARFLVMNSDNMWSVDDQFKWLHEELKNAQEKLIFIVYHHPTFTVTTKHHWRERESFQLKMRDVLKEHEGKITALLLGHDHISTFVDFGKTPAIIAGAGREVRAGKVLNYKEDGFHVKTRFLAPRIQHWALLEISDASDEAKIHWIRVSDQKNVCTASFRGGSMHLEQNCP